MRYETCTRKKLVSLFEYLDKDRDGLITPFDLQSGMTRLQAYGTGLVGSDVGEFEIEELLRCVPSADINGSISLKAFLDSEVNLLPGLTKLRLLQ